MPPIHRRKTATAFDILSRQGWNKGYLDAMALDQAHPVNAKLLQALLQQTQPVYLASAGGEIAFANDAYRQLIADDLDGAGLTRRKCLTSHQRRL